MKKNLTHEQLVHVHHTLKTVRFMQFGHKVYRHVGRDVAQVRQAWNRFQANPVAFLASSPADLSRDVLALCE